MKLSPEAKEQARLDGLKEHGRVIARGMHEENMRREKNMATAEKRKATMLERAAERALSGRNY